jgi:hypothetical protein
MTNIIVEYESVVCRSQAPVETQIDGEVVLMNLDRDRCYGLGQTGSEIWRRLGSPISVAVLCNELERKYQAPTGVIANDVMRLLRELATEELIEIHEPVKPRLKV